MNPDQIESGLQLVSRIRQCTVINDLQGICTDFLHDIKGPYANEIIEINGEIWCRVMFELLLRAILPSNQNRIWKGVNTLLINTSFHLNVLDIIGQVGKLLAQTVSNTLERKKYFKMTLKRFTIINCYTHHDYELTLRNLKHLLEDKSHISLVFIDNIGAHFPTNVSEKDCTLLQYCNSCLSFVRNLNTVIVFGKPSKLQLPLQHVDYTITK